MRGLRQRRRVLGALCAVLALTAACSQGRAGTALPDGAEAAQYVSDKFAATLQRLDDDLAGNEPRKSTHRSFTRIDDKKADVTITAIQVGSPPSRLFKNHSNRDSADYRDYFHPAGSDVEYIHLGPVYSSLAPTPWVSEPYDGGGLSPCAWGGYATVCKMLNAVGQAMEDSDTKKQAKSLRDGSVELTIEITLRQFLDQRIVVIPDWALENITPEMREGVIPTRIVLDPEGELKEIEMKALISADGHEIQINEHHQVLAPPTESELPKIPPPSQVTELKTEKQVEDFYRRMDEITSAGD